MKLLLVIISILLLSTLNLASAKNQQDHSGIQWVKGLTWNEIKAKANSENKYIFVDCYATWCGPCKEMDKLVYPNDTVGDYMNAKYLSVKLQLDTAKNDNEEIKKWYKTAAVIKNDFSINAMPTYLFFSPEGKIVHKSIGGLNVPGFVKLANEALDSSKQYFSLANAFRENRLSNDGIAYLAKLAKFLGENDFSSQVASQYIQNYLNQLNEDKFCTKENLAFINDFKAIVKSSDKVFKMYFNNRKRIDSIKSQGYANGLIDFIITKEELLPSIESSKLDGTNPDWKKNSKNIKTKYGPEFANRNVLNSEVSFYKYKKDWKNYIESLIRYIEVIGIDNFKGFGGAYYLNNRAWEVFQHSDKKRELEKALTWSTVALKLDTTSNLIPGNMDTKANLLYKLGRKSEAIEIEEKVVLLDPKNSEFQETLCKMKQHK